MSNSSIDILYGMLVSAKPEDAKALLGQAVRRATEGTKAGQPKP